MRHGRGVRSPASLGVGVSVGRRQAVSEPGVNPNLLLWTEEFQQATWAKSGVSVSADAIVDPLAGSTADRLTFDPEGSVAQASTTAATTGATVTATKTPTSSWVRYSLTGTFDGAEYTFSVWAKDSGFSFRMAMFRSGGVLVCQVSNPDDVEGFTLDLWGAKLETGSSATGTAATYGKREGT